MLKKKLLRFLLGESCRRVKHFLLSSTARIECFVHSGLLSKVLLFPIPDDISQVPVSFQYIKPVADRANPKMGIGMLAFSPDNCFLATRNGKFLLSPFKGETFLLYVHYPGFGFMFSNNNLLFIFLHIYSEWLHILENEAHSSFLLHFQCLSLGRQSSSQPVVVGLLISTDGHGINTQVFPLTGLRAVMSGCKSCGSEAEPINSSITVNSSVKISEGWKINWVILNRLWGLFFLQVFRWFPLFCQITFLMLSGSGTFKNWNCL